MDVTKRERGLLLVMIEIEPGFEDDFNAWYREEHFAERMACPGFLTGKRFVALEGGPKYLAIYELASPSVLESEEYKKIVGPSPWLQRLKPHFVKYVRNVYVEIDP
jgi:hypothetical protein